MSADMPDLASSPGRPSPIHQTNRVEHFHYGTGRIIGGGWVGGGWVGSNKRRVYVDFQADRYGIRAMLPLVELRRIGG